MAMRKSMTRSQSDRNFRRGNRTHGRNFATALRGGYRL